MSTPKPADDPMSLGIDLYQTDDYVKVARIGMLPILRSVFEQALGRHLEDAQFLLTFLAVTDRNELDGNPSVVNLRSSHGYVQVRIESGGTLVYQHPHSVREIFARPLQQLLRDQQPEETHWGFGIAGPGLEHMALIRPAPQTRGATDVTVRADRPRRFLLEQLPEPDPPEIDAAELGAEGDTPWTGTGVVFSTNVYEELMGGMHFSTDIEEGGFLLGHLFRDRDRPGELLVRIVQALPAERTGASLLQFTFTGESFLRVNQTVAQRDLASPDGTKLRLVGWYHTHLFPATDGLGLSTIDIDLHARTFLQSWHVAGLVNIDRGTRQLRVYGRDGGPSMQQLSYRIGPAWTQ